MVLLVYIPHILWYYNLSGVGLFYTEIWEGKRKMRKNTWTCLLLILAGIVIGGFVGTALPNTFLYYGQSFGLTSPLILDLGIIAITFGLTIKITIASIIGIAIGVLVYRLL